jgi:hypothetical protein
MFINKKNNNVSKNFCVFMIRSSIFRIAGMTRVWPASPQGPALGITGFQLCKASFIPLWYV